MCLKKIFILVLFFLCLYIILRFGYRFYGGGHNYTYEVETNDIRFSIQEIFINNKKNSNYYLQITNGEEKFYYQTFENFKNKSKIIDDVFYYEDDKYQCILPVYSGKKILSDILCKSQNDYLYFYHNLQGINENLDAFASSLSSAGYNVEQWIDNSDVIAKDGIKNYYQNISKEHFILLTDYKGILLVNGNDRKINYISLFDSDIYQKRLDMLYKNKYIVADYNTKYRFHEFYVIDMLTGATKKIISDSELSFDSYIQGIIDDKIYFFDKDAKKQYSIDMKEETVSEVGNENIGIKIYVGGQWQIVSAVTVSNEEIKFQQENNLYIDDKNYAKIYQYGNDKFGYYYYYKKVDDKYLVYRANVQDNSQLVYLFSTTNIDNIYFSHQDIYFVDDEYIKRYSDSSGTRKVIEYNELKYNDNLFFGVYINQ